MPEQPEEGPRAAVAKDNCGKSSPQGTGINEAKEATAPSALFLGRRPSFSGGSERSLTCEEPRGQQSPSEVPARQEKLLESAPQADSTGLICPQSSRLKLHLQAASTACLQAPTYKTDQGTGVRVYRW